MNKSLTLTIALTLALTLSSLLSVNAQLASTETALAPNSPQHALSINGFRNPSIGLEYERSNWSIHAGYYPTILSTAVSGANPTTSFIKAGVSKWFLHFGTEQQSSLYAGVSGLYGLDQDYRNIAAAMAELGIRVYVWQGLHARLGIAVLAAPNREVEINPTPSIGYTIRF